MKSPQFSNKYFLFLFLSLGYISNLYGYLGPGMAGGFIITILSIAGTILIFFWGILYYPIKRFILKMRKKIFHK
tara:strand:+ start:909 stop:1130 length:222 start_codon:yes stop_codon:yes gene_type:complete